MASILRETNGRKTIQFVDPDNGRRKLKIRLGKVSARDGEFFKNKIERLIACRITGSPMETEVANWINGLSEAFKQRLAVLGLVERQPDNRPGPLGEFIDEYLASRSKLKASTIVNLKQARRRLVEFFGETQDIRKITPGDADRWREEMIRENLADATVSRHVKRARQFFRTALRRRLISENPFSELPAPEQINRNREFFVTREAINKVIDCCPDDEWKLIVALCRFGGFRCPSEHFALRTGDVDWEKKRIRVHSSKTEHHRHGGNRVIPLFPELIPYLTAVLQTLKSDESPIIDHKRWSSNNLRTSFLKIIKKAGLVPWPRVFQNLRASRQTELTNKYPIHVVCEWMGNTRLVAVKHYLQVTDEHFDDAIRERQ